MQQKNKSDTRIFTWKTPPMQKEKPQDLVQFKLPLSTIMGYTCLF